MFFKYSRIAEGFIELVEMNDSIGFLASAGSLQAPEAVKVAKKLLGDSREAASVALQGLQIYFRDERGVDILKHL